MLEDALSDRSLLCKLENMHQKIIYTIDLTMIMSNKRISILLEILFKHYAFKS